MRSRTIAAPVIVAGLAVCAVVAEARAGLGGPPLQEPVRPYVDAARGVTIDELVERALREAPPVLASRSREAEARGLEAQAALRPNPGVSAQRREEAGAPGHQTTAGLTWPLDLFRRDGRVAVAAREASLARDTTREAEWRLAGRVRTQAGRVLAAVRRLEISGAVAAASRETLDLVTARVTAGAAPALERDQATIEWRRREADAIRLRAEIDAELAMLKALVGLEATAPLALRDDLESATRLIRAAPLPAVEAGGAPGPVEGRPDVRVADATVDRAAAREDLALRNGRFDASLVASYARARGGFPQQGLDGSGRPVPIGGRTHNLIVGVNLMLPWRDANQGAIAAASAAVSTARHVLDARRLEATAELAAAESRDAASAGVLETLGGNARLLASRNLDVVRESYELGRATLGDVLDETRRYLEFESAYTAALVEAFDARVALTLAMGVIR